MNLARLGALALLTTSFALGCSSAPQDQQALVDLDPALHTQSGGTGGGGTGGGGTGGGGTGGGGTGGGGTTIKWGSLRPVSATTTCSDGTVLDVALDKGANQQIQLTLTTLVAANPVTVGYLTLQISDVATGQFYLNQGSVPGGFLAGQRITTLGGHILPGDYVLRFDGVVHDGAFDGPALVTCSVDMAATAQ